MLILFIPDGLHEQTDGWSMDASPRQQLTRPRYRTDELKRASFEPLPEDSEMLKSRLHWY